MTFFKLTGSSLFLQKVYQERVYLLFSGVHFDAIVFGTFGQRRVPPTHLGAQQSARDLGTSLRTSGKFVDQATMQLQL